MGNQILLIFFIKHKNKDRITGRKLAAHAISQKTIAIVTALMVVIKDQADDFSLFTQLVVVNCHVIYDRVTGHRNIH